MTIQTKAAGRGDAPTAYKIILHFNHSSTRSLVKAATGSLEIHGLPQYRATDWLIQGGGLRDA